MAARHRLGSGCAQGAVALLLAASVTACGQADDADTATDRGTSTSTTSTVPTVPTASSGAPTTTGGRFEVRLLHGTGAGGRVSRVLSPVAEPGEVGEALGSVRNPTLRHQVVAAVRSLIDAGRPAYVAVVAVGCDVPPGAEVVPGTDGTLGIVARKVADPLPECFAPVTTVAVVSTRS